MICELPEFYQTSEPIARKPYKCCECSAPILKGEKHVRCVGNWGDGVQTYRQHVACCQACEFIRDKFNDGCIPFGSLFEYVDEMKWQYDRVRDRHKESWVKLRHLLAVIKWRERTG